MENMRMITSVDKIFFSYTSGDKVFVIGSRKVNQVDISAEFDSFDMTSLYGTSVSGCIPGPTSYNLTGSMRGFIQVVGNTFEEALFNLLLAFREEEQEEKEQVRLAAERAEAYAAQRQGYDDDDYYDDAYDEYDYDYDDGECSCYWCQR